MLHLVSHLHARDPINRAILFNIGLALLQKSTRSIFRNNEGIKYCYIQSLCTQLRISLVEFSGCINLQWIQEHPRNVYIGDYSFDPKVIIRDKRGLSWDCPELFSQKVIFKDLHILGKTCSRCSSKQFRWLV